MSQFYNHFIAILICLFYSRDIKNINEELLLKKEYFVNQIKLFSQFCQLKFFPPRYPLAVADFKTKTHLELIIFIHNKFYIQYWLNNALFITSSFKSLCVRNQLRSFKTNKFLEFNNLINNLITKYFIPVFISWTEIPINILW